MIENAIVDKNSAWYIVHLYIYIYILQHYIYNFIVNQLERLIFFFLITVYEILWTLNPAEITFEKLPW